MYCRFNPDTVGSTCTGYVDIKNGDEKALKEAVATIGPISVAIDAGHVSFMFYQSCESIIKNMKMKVLLRVVLGIIWHGQ